MYIRSSARIARARGEYEVSRALAVHARARGRAREASRVTVVGGVIASVRARARARDRPGVINQFVVRPETCKSEREESSHRERY